MADSSYGYRFLLVGLIVATNAFFAAAEASLLSARKSRIQQLADEGDAGAKAALQLLANPERLLSVVQVGVTLASLGLGWAGEETIHQLFLSWMQPLIVPWTAKIVPVFALVLSFGLMTYMHVVIGEVVPKNIAIETADRFAVLVAPILLVFARIAGPLVTIIERSSKRISRQLGLRGDGEGGGGHTVEELKFIVSLSEAEGKIQKFQQLAIHRLLELEDYSAREIMVPRNNMVAVPLHISLEQLLVLLNDHQFSRLPVYERSSDQIVGIVHLKDLIHVLMQRGELTKFSLKDVMRVPIVVPETRSLSNLIDVFRAHNTHMAVVVDEHGSTTGVVTLEDVLEQVFGEIEDEHDISRPKEDHQAAAVELEGTINIPDLANQYGVALPADGGFETLAGYLLSKLGDLPREGVVLEEDGRRFTILKMERNRIARVRIERLEIAP
ncbi:MAG: HlyC/CorC family transporter [Bryobacterales bacterium]|nr:HlyC/CorC family transporter [Bryobacterales bacterium]